MIQATLVHFRSWEPTVSRSLVLQLQEGDTAVDVGANIGYYSLLFAHAVGPQGKVVAVEALPRLAGEVQVNARINGHSNIRVVNLAAGDAGRVTLYEAPRTNIGMTTTCADRGFPASCEVESRPLDQILSEDERIRCALIKIDIEGAEVPVVQRFLETRELYPRNPALAVEVSPTPEWEALFEGLVAAGYLAFDLHNDYDWLTLLDALSEPTQISVTPSRQADVLFVHISSVSSAL